MQKPRSRGPGNRSRAGTTETLETERFRAGTAGTITGMPAQLPFEEGDATGDDAAVEAPTDYVLQELRHHEMLHEQELKFNAEQELAMNQSPGPFHCI